MKLSMTSDTLIEIKSLARAMSLSGQTRTSEDVQVTSAHPSITDIKRTLGEVRHGPVSDIHHFERICPSEVRQISI